VLKVLYSIKTIVVEQQVSKKTCGVSIIRDGEMGQVY